MKAVMKGLLVLAVLAFIMAAIEVIFKFRILAAPEAFSRAATNLSLIVIAISVCCKKDS